ncbi:NAD(P)-binding protein [Exidia glandulosa HHB12029]|uniref:NAD(P)-binding protein n=1 Tax=Exidia glandulosa HHB12029 TaxID=1314781 RepID=A0A165F4J3_EXIGL|nr:NAD(P)-binding protein [Exidia glandulosa HHB12029]
MSSRRCIALVGGTGFLGRHIAAYLKTKGLYAIRVGTRSPTRARNVHGEDNVQVVQADVTQPDTLATAFSGADVVVSLAGYLQASEAQFDLVQRRGAGNVAAAARNAGASLVHVSAIGADPRSSLPYWRTKALGEQEVLKELPTATIIRPSLVFGPGDEFFGRFAKLARILPFMPVFDGGVSRFQPVYVGDIAKFVELCARGTPEVSSAVSGKVVEAGGPEIFTYRELMQLVLKYSHRRRPILSLPSAVGKFQAFFSEKLPPNLFSLTRDQIEQLKYDNIVAADPRLQPQTLDFDDFLLRFSDDPKLASVHEILPRYL